MNYVVSIFMFSVATVFAWTVEAATAAMATNSNAAGIQNDRKVNEADVLLERLNMASTNIFPPDASTANTVRAEILFDNQETREIKLQLATQGITICRANNRYFNANTNAANGHALTSDVQHSLAMLNWQAQYLIDQQKIPLMKGMGNSELRILDEKMKLADKETFVSWNDRMAIYYVVDLKRPSATNGAVVANDENSAVVATLLDQLNAACTNIGMREGANTNKGLSVVPIDGTAINEIKAQLATNGVTLLLKNGRYMNVSTTAANGYSLAPNIRRSLARINFLEQKGCFHSQNRTGLSANDNKLLFEIIRAKEELAQNDVFVSWNDEKGIYIVKKAPINN